MWALKNDDICYWNFALPADVWFGRGNLEAWSDQKKKKQEIWERAKCARSPRETFGSQRIIKDRGEYRWMYALCLSNTVCVCVSLMTEQSRLSLAGLILPSVMLAKSTKRMISRLDLSHLEYIYLIFLCGYKHQTWRKQVFLIQANLFLNKGCLSAFWPFIIYIWSVIMKVQCIICLGYTAVRDEEQSEEAECHRSSSRLTSHDNRFFSVTTTWVFCLLSETTNCCYIPLLLKHYIFSYVRFKV